MPTSPGWPREIARDMCHLEFMFASPKPADDDRVVGVSDYFHLDV